MAGILNVVYVALVFLVTVGGLLALAYTTRDLRSDRGFASDLAITGLVAGLIVGLALTVL